MRNFDRNSGYKNNNSSNYSRNDRRDDRNERYYSDDKNRNSSNKSFERNKKPRRDYDDQPRHSYQDHRQGGNNRSFDGGDRFHDRSSYRSNDHHSKNERSFRNHSPPKRSRDRDGHSDARNSGVYRSRNMSPPPQTRRNDYNKPSTSTGIKNRLAPLRSRINNSTNSRMTRTVGNKILRRNDLRSGLVSKRSTTMNRAKDYARKIRQARMKLNEGGSSTSSSRLKSTIEARSPKKDSEETHHRGKNDDIGDDYLAISNDVNFDEDENESTGGKNSFLKDELKINKEEKEEDAVLNENKNNVKSEKDKKLLDESTSSKDEKDEKKTSRVKKSASPSRTPSKERVRKFDRIEYSCIHCGKRSTSAQEYRSHLSGRHHLYAMREVNIRVRTTLNRLRKVQRDKQLEIEARISDVENIQSKYCQVCKLNFRQSKEEHRESDDHKKISSFLKPYCKICRMKLISPMKYEIHRCHTDHIRRKLKAQEGSDDEVNMEEMDIGDFKTVDSVGNVDDDGEMIEEDLNNQDETDDLLGMDCIKKIDAFYCFVCLDFIHNPRGKNKNAKDENDEDEEKLIKEHCKMRRHISRYQDNKKDEERKAKSKVSKENSKDGQKSPEKSSIKHNGNEDKNEKNLSNEIDRDADVNIDENTNEESKHSDDDSKFNRYSESND